MGVGVLLGMYVSAPLAFLMPAETGRGCLIPGTAFIDG